MKLYEKYLKSKLNDKNKIYIFRSGIFYVCLDEDAKVLNDKYGLSLTPFNNEILKCGFPIKSASKYFSMFDNDKINYEIVKESNSDAILKIIEKVDIQNITPIEALNILNEVVEHL